jgi:hypothetical protein
MMMNATAAYYMYWQLKEIQTVAAVRSCAGWGRFEELLTIMSLIISSEWYISFECSSEKKRHTDDVIKSVYFDDWWRYNDYDDNNKLCFSNASCFNKKKKSVNCK